MRVPRPAGRALVVVPTYNEAASVADVARRLFEAAPGVELLVVDDASRDGTAGVVRSLAAGRAGVHLVERPGKQGLGTAYVAGFRWAMARGYDAVVEMDADGSHDPASVPALLDALRDADLAIGSRYVPGGRIHNWGLLRRLLSRAGNLYARAWLGFDVKDSTSGFRAFRVAWLEREELADVRSEGYAFQIEMTRRVHRAGGRVVEVPITFTERMHGKSKLSRRIVLEALVEVARWGIRDRLRTTRERALGEPRP
ncbi:MAG TPA: polyprenol monophosphomannose synthase [Actinomycetota bacterium]|nr:polyprenol monophosphomannose synthase [Actinomycetota bacterium]